MGSDFFSNLTLVLIFHGQKMGSKTGFDGICWIFEMYNVTQINCCVTNLLRHKVGFIVLVPNDQITVFFVSFVCSQSGFLVP